VRDGGEIERDVATLARESNGGLIVTGSSSAAATWEITITCRDGSRLHFSERSDTAPQKGEIFEADVGQIIKARIDAYREEKPRGLRPPFSRSRRPNCKVGRYEDPPLPRRSRISAESFR
jgi:hypothetical protein